MARKLLLQLRANPIGGFVLERTWHLQHRIKYWAIRPRFRGNDAPLHMPGGKSLPDRVLATHPNRYRRDACY